MVIRARWWAKQRENTSALEHVFICMNARVVPAAPPCAMTSSQEAKVMHDSRGSQLGGEG